MSKNLKSLIKNGNMYKSNGIVRDVIVEKLSSKKILLNINKNINTPANSKNIKEQLPNILKKNELTRRLIIGNEIKLNCSGFNEYEFEKFKSENELIIGKYAASPTSCIILNTIFSSKK